MFRTLEGKEGGCCLDTVDDAFRLLDAEEDAKFEFIQSICMPKNENIRTVIETALHEKRSCVVYIDDVTIDADGEYEFGGLVTHAFFLFREQEKIQILQSYGNEYPCRIDTIELNRFLSDLERCLIDPNLFQSLWEDYFYSCLPCPPNSEHYLVRVRFAC